MQIHAVITTIGIKMEGLECHVFIGGTPLSQDRSRLKKCHIAVGSPGRSSCAVLWVPVTLHGSITGPGDAGLAELVVINRAQPQRLKNTLKVDCWGVWADVFGAVCAVPPCRAVLVVINRAQPQRQLKSTLEVHC